MGFVLQFIVIGLIVLIVLDLIIGWPFDMTKKEETDND